eukprot:TRINITY_DN51225_c0_g1_i1.p1 TRINITY_DN51225_c0_g1~~TRINITY_DN51225_c0_g1_i1.p1  ORF type:complete len:668 (-),score=56.08 TRINITY_DN51225_c0_g1_i1:15-1940(-)
MAFMLSGLAILSSPSCSIACTTVAAGPKATADGSVIIGHSDDGDPISDARLVHVPAADHPSGAVRFIYNTQGEFPRSVSRHRGADYEPNPFTDLVLGANAVLKPIGTIPEVPHTFAYHDTDYGAINEHNVAIAESTCSSMFRTCQVDTDIGCEPGRDKGEALLDIGSLSQLALERARTAREAVQLMGHLAFRYGFFGTQDANGYGEALQVADPNEVWTFNILADDTGTKAIWAAVRVPDDHVTVLANMFTIRDVDTNDTQNCMASANVYSVAEKYGWWKPGEILDFTKVYSNGEYDHKYYSGRRMWRVLSLAAPSLKLEPDYDDLKYSRQWPWSVKPDRLITRQDVLSWYRDWYSGTSFDMTKGLAAGYGGTPDRFDHSGKPWGAWERSIALFRTNFVLVEELYKSTQARPRESAGVLWFAAGPAHYSPFLPVPSGLTLSLPPLATQYPWRFLQGSMNWACRKVMTIAQVRFDFMHPLVVEKQNQIEAAGANVLLEATHRFSKDADQKAYNQAFVDHAFKALEVWHSLADEMLFSYSDNHRIADTPAGSFPPALDYPGQWLLAAGFPKGPPAVPPIRPGQCPNWDRGCSSEAYYAGIAKSWLLPLVITFLVFVAVLMLCDLRRRHAKTSSAREHPCPYSEF